MADSTTALIKHNLNINNIDEFKFALEKILEISIQHTIEINNIEDELNYPETFSGWSLTVYNYPEHKNIRLHENIDKGREISFGECYAFIEGFCLNYISQWFMISHCLDKSDSYHESNFLRERNEIYKLAIRFGSKDCMLMNGSRLDELAEDVSNGIPLNEAIAKYENNNPITREQLNYQYSNNARYINSRSKIKVIYLHKIDHSQKFVDSDDWYDTILIDDFSDLKIQQK